MTEQDTAGTRVEDRVARPGGVSYLRIPARDITESAQFYRAVFGWRLRGSPDAPSFSDGTGHVIGHWRTDLPAAGQAGACPTSTSPASTTPSARQPRTAPRSSPRPTGKETSRWPPSGIPRVTSSASGRPGHAEPAGAALSCPC